MIDRTTEGVCLFCNAPVEGSPPFCSESCHDKWLGMGLLNRLREEEDD